MTTPDKHIILFDGICNLCTGIVKFIIRKDPGAKFKFASLQSNYGIMVLEKYKLSKESLDTIVYIKNETHYIKSTAALKVMYDMGFPYNLMIILLVIPKRFRDLIYDKIANSRYKKFGKRDSCMVPDPDITKRFLE
jgi:predicted DCC family thiol-disulfide oxidoreductase YuxK